MYSLTDAQDDEPRVRGAALRCLLGLMDTLPPEVRRRRLLPLLGELCDCAGSDPKMQRVVAESYGHMVSRAMVEVDSTDENQVSGVWDLGFKP